MFSFHYTTVPPQHDLVAAQNEAFCSSLLSSTKLGHVIKSLSILFLEKLRGLIGEGSYYYKNLIVKKSTHTEAHIEE